MAIKEKREIFSTVLNKSHIKKEKNNSLHLIQYAKINSKCTTDLKENISRQRFLIRHTPPHKNLPFIIFFKKPKRKTYSLKDTAEITKSKAMYWDKIFTKHIHTYYLTKDLYPK